MQSKEETRVFLARYAEKWPELTIDDLIKLLYQSAFGCGHFAPGEAQVLSYLKEELSMTQADAQGALVEPILGKYARVHIAPYAAQGMALKTLARLFMMTADEAPGEDAQAWFEGALDALQALADDGKLPFPGEAVRARLGAYRAAGCPSLHHSEAFRAAYHPAYRVLRADYAQLLPVFAHIDRLLAEKERVIVAIDGNSGAGKSTLAQLIAGIYDDMTLVHMDDFFLQLHQRTPERFETPGGNVDHERFDAEVLAPMRRGEAFCYRPLDCARMAIGEGRTIAPGRLCVVEGSYSMHPSLERAYDLKLVLRISPAEQEKRILKRNGPQMLGRFMREWIPMENLYFDATRIEERGDLLLGVTALEDGAAAYDVRRA